MHGIEHEDRHKILHVLWNWSFFLFALLFPFRLFDFHLLFSDIYHLNSIFCPNPIPEVRRMPTFGRSRVSSKLRKKRHRTPKDTTGQRFNCPNCTRSYMHLGSLKIHLKWECGKEPAFQCHLCDYRCKVRGNLKSHMTHMHSKWKITTEKKLRAISYA